MTAAIKEAVLFAISFLTFWNCSQQGVSTYVAKYVAAHAC